MYVTPLFALILTVGASYESIISYVCLCVTNSMFAAAIHTKMAIEYVPIFQMYPKYTQAVLLQFMLYYNYVTSNTQFHK